MYLNEGLHAVGESSPTMPTKVDASIPSQVNFKTLSADQVAKAVAMRWAYFGSSTADWAAQNFTKYQLLAAHGWVTQQRLRPDLQRNQDEMRNLDLINSYISLAYRKAT